MNGIDTVKEILSRLARKFEKMLEVMSIDLHLIHLFQPILIGFGIISYYLLPIIPTWKLCLVLIFIPVLFRALDQRLMSILSSYILIGFLAFHLRVIVVNYEPAIVPIKEVTIIAKIKDIEPYISDEIRDSSVRQDNSHTGKQDKDITGACIVLENIRLMEIDAKNLEKSKNGKLGEIDKKYVFPRQAKMYVKYRDASLFSNASLDESILCKARFFPIAEKKDPNDFDSKFYNYFSGMSANCELINVYKIGYEDVSAEKKILDLGSNFDMGREYKDECNKYECNSKNNTDSNIEYKKSLRIASIRYKISRFLEQVNNPGLAQALILGNRRNLSIEIQELCKKLGIYHMLSISGLHLSIVAGIGSFIGLLIYIIITMIGKAVPIVNFIKIVKKHPDIALILPPNPNTYKKLTAILLIIIYTILTGASIPSIRACVMYVLGIIVFFSDLNTNLVHMLAAACSLILVTFPETLFSSSFQFSFVAMYAISLFKPFKRKVNFIADVIMSKLPKKYKNLHEPTLVEKIVLYTCNTIFSCAMISLYTIPLSIYHFQEIALQPILANLICVPFIVFIIIPSLIIHICFGFLSMHYSYIGILLYKMTLQCINIELNIFIHMLKILEYTAIQLHMPEINKLTMICFFTLLPLAHSKTRLRIAHLAIMPLFVISIVMSVEKPIMLLDKYGRIGYMKDEILYVSFRTEDRLAEKWKKYYKAKEIRYFQHKIDTPLFGYYIKNTESVKWDSKLKGDSKIITQQDCLNSNGLAVYRGEIKPLNRNNKLHAKMIFAY